MAAEKKYDKILEEVCEKLNSIDSIKDLDLLEIKNSVEAIESLVTDTQAKVNFQEIKEKLENISLQVDSCNETLLKDLYNDMNSIKEKSDGIGAYLENIQNVQNLALTSTEFEEYQKQQLDLALKTNENIYNAIKKIQENQVTADYTENIQNLDKKVSDLHQSLSVYIKQLFTKIDTSQPEFDSVMNVIKDISSINQKNIQQTNNLVKTLENNFNNFKDKEFAEQISKISEIYDSLNIIHAWIEKVGFLNKSIENVYARLGANIDFDDVSEKIDIIYENITALNEWTMKIDNVDSNMTDICTKITSLNSFFREIGNINSEIKNIKNKIDKMESSFFEGLDFEDFTNKMDIIYENLTALNGWAIKIDAISSKGEEINNKFIELDDKFSEIVSQINENIGEELNQISQRISDTDSLITDIPDMKSKLNELSEELHLITRTTKNETESYVYTLLDIEADFLKLHQFLDNKTEQSSKDIISLKERFEELNDDISSISKRTNKLILSADDANKEFKMHLETFKNTIASLDLQRQMVNPEIKFQAIGEKLAIISKLIQNNAVANNKLNNAFAYLAEWIDATGSILNNLSEDVSAIKASSANNENLNEISELKKEIETSVNSINSLTETISNVTNNDISDIKSMLTGIMVQLNTALTPDIDSLNDRIDKLSEENENKFSALEILLKEKTDIQEKQILALEEKVEGLYSRIDKLIETIGEGNDHNEVKDVLNYLTTQMAAANETLARRQVTADEITKISEEQNETKNALKEVMIAQQSIAEKLSSFDSNVNKIVSYIEEE